MPAPEASLNLGNTPVKLRWEEPNASSGTDHKTQGIIPKGVYRGFSPVAQVGTFLLDLVPDAVAGDSIAVFETTAQTVADGGVPAFNPTAGFNLTVFTSATVTIDLTAVTKNVSRLLVFRVQYDEGNNFPTQALVRAIPVADLQATDVIIAQFTIPLAAPNLDTTTFTPGEDARTLLSPFVTVGDGFESKGDFTGNRPNAAGSDTSGVITTAANALDARRTVFGVLSPGVIFVKRGDYTISATIPLRNKTALVGEDQNGVVLRQGAAAIRIFDFDVAAPTKSDEIRVDQVFLSGHAAATEPVVQMSGASNIRIRDVTVSYSVALPVPVRIIGASVDCVVRDVRRLAAPALADTVELGGTSTRCRVEGAPLNVRQSIGASSQNEVTTSRVTHPGATAIDGTILSDLRPALGAARDLRLGAVTQYLRGYIRGLDIMAAETTTSGGGLVFVTDGVIEIDGMMYELSVPTNITALIPVAANAYSYIYAGRDFGTGGLAFTGVTGNAAGHPVYLAAQNAWVFPGSGVGGAPTVRYIGCVLSITGAVGGVGAYQRTLKIGDTTYLDGSNAVVGTVNPQTVVIGPLLPGTPTLSATMNLTGLPLVESNRTIVVGGGGDNYVGGLACLLDVEVRVAYAGGAQNNKTVAILLDGPNNQRTSLSANLIQQTTPASPAPLLHRFPAVRTLVDVRNFVTGLFLANPTTTITATVAGLVGADSATVTVVAHQRGYVDVR